MVKLIHRWLPTQVKVAQQQRMDKSICPRCNTEDETQLHMGMCLDPDAVKEQMKEWAKRAHTLRQCGMAPEIILAWDKEVRTHLQMPASKLQQGTMGQNERWTKWAMTISS